MPSPPWFSSPPPSSRSAQRDISPSSPDHDQAMQLNLQQQLSKLSEHVESLLSAWKTVDDISRCVDYLGTLPEEVAKLQADVKLVLKQSVPSREATLQSYHDSDNCVKVSPPPFGPPTSSKDSVGGSLVKITPPPLPPTYSKDSVGGVLENSSSFRSVRLARGKSSNDVLRSSDTNNLANLTVPEDAISDHRTISSATRVSSGNFASKDSSENNGHTRATERTRKRTSGPSLRRANSTNHQTNLRSSSTPTLLPRSGNLMFGDFADQQPLDEKEYDVRDYYYEDGIISKIARSDSFPNVTMLVIVVNALYIGIEADGNRPDASKTVHVIYDICDNVFCSFFMFELLVRFLAFEKKVNCIYDSWFKFDAALLIMMIWDTWVMPFTSLDDQSPTGATGLVKLLRLLRLARISRVVRYLPELVAMMKGLKIASRAVGAALFMLVMLIYVFAIALFTLLKDSTQPFLLSRFNGLITVMWTVLIDGTFLDNVGLVVRNLQDEREYFALFTFVIFVLASALTVMNMLIGVLCEVVTSVAKAEKDNSAVRLVKAQLLVLLQELDEDGSGLISREEIRQVLDHEAALKALKDLRVDGEILLANLDMYYAERQSDLTMQEIMELILLLRGDSEPTMQHILQCQAFLQYQFQCALKALDVSITF